jgi:tetratricopeptide (TPR) repeat protein
MTSSSEPVGWGDRVEVRGGQGVQVGQGNQQINQYITMAGDTAQSDVPGMLPRDTPGFTGRAEELARITGLKRGDSAVVCAIDGTAGVGKTSLAVHAAYILLPEFPDGQLFADLHGYTEGQPATDPGEVLESFLLRLGVRPENLPAGVEQRSQLLRQELAGKRVLIVLDNAASEEQIRPLLPGAGPSLVLITSRATLMGLELDEHVDLDELPEDDATALLVQLVGQERSTAEPEAVAEVRDYCGCLPLALRIAGQLLAVHLAWPVSQLAGLLADERRRLDRLAAGDLQVRAAFMVSYRLLPTEDARMFRLISLHPGPDFTALTAASAAGIEQDAAAEVLDRLALVHLIIEGAFSRFGMHDLLRLFAREASEAEDAPAARRATQVRIVGHYAELAGFGDSLLSPQPGLTAEKTATRANVPANAPQVALRMFELERQNILAAVRLAAKLNEPQIVSQLSMCLDAPFRRLGYFEELTIISQTALETARRVGNKNLEAWALTELGRMSRYHGNFEIAISYYVQARSTRQEIGDRRGEAQVLADLSIAYGSLQRTADAITVWEQALAIFREIGDKEGEGHVLGNLASTYRELRRFDEALTTQQDAVRILREAGDRGGEARALANLGITYGEMERVEEAVPLFQKALEILQEIGDRYGAGMALAAFGQALFRIQRFIDAISASQQALTIFHDVGDRFHEGIVLSLLGAASQEAGRFGNALDYSLQALTMLRKTGNRHGEARALATLGITYRKLGRIKEAIAPSEQALTIFQEFGDLPGELGALDNLRIVYLHLNQPSKAAVYRQAIIQILQETGEQPTAT